MSESILSNEKRCYICGQRDFLHKHHIYAGANRQRSEESGCWVYLCPNHHTGRAGVHQNPVVDKMLKKVCQQRYEALHGREDFIKEFGKSYVDD